VISPGRRGAPLLAGLAAGAVLVGAIVLAAPAGALPVELGPVAAVPVAAAVPTSTPVTTTSRRPTVPRPVITSVPTTPPTTTTTTTAPTTTTSPPTTSESPEPTSTAPAPTGGDEAAAVVAATNAERADAGCDPLETDDRLTAAAQGHAADMATGDYFSHTSEDGREFDDRIRAEGHPAPGGENIAAGQDSAAEVVSEWMRSPGHRRNILDCDFVSIGVGFDDRGNQWVQNFGR
jgi:uncharacterized protein YkwD